MVSAGVYPLSVQFAIITGTGAGLLSLLSWEVFRRSPIEKVPAALSLVMSLAVVYHSLVLVVEPGSLALTALGGAVYGVFAVGIWMTIRTHSTIDASLAEYRKSPVVAVSGMVAFVGIGLAGELLFPSVVHWIHGVAALLVVIGLYTPVYDDLRADEWGGRLLSEPARTRRPADWMTPMDDSILELLYSSELVLTPAIIGFNIDRSREAVNRRVTELERRGFIEKIERGKYRITRFGVRYVRGPFHAAEEDEW